MHKITADEIKMALAKREDMEKQKSPSESMFDANLGYLASESINDYVKDVKLNVIDEHAYESRVREIFEELGEVLGKSYGPFGSHTFIMNGFDAFPTKDGFTIANSLYYTSMDENSSIENIQLSNIIRSMIFTICGRLNNAVGDGTTSAVKITNAVYQEFYEKRSKGEWLHNIRSKDIVSAFETVKDMIVHELQASSNTLTISDRDTLLEEIKQIIYIASNGDDTITDNVSKAYKEIGYPAIRVNQTEINTTTVDIVEGFQFTAFAADPVYLNNNGRMDISDCNVLLFDAMVTEDVYLKIIRPIYNGCQMFGRKLVILAPSYDKNAKYIMVADIRRESNKTHRFDLVLVEAKLKTAYDQKAYSDLSVVLNTEVLSRGKIRAMINKMSELNVGAEYLVNMAVKKEGYHFYDPYSKNPNGIRVYSREGDAEIQINTIDDFRKDIYDTCKDDMITIGYAGNIVEEKGGMIFTDLYFNTYIYNLLIEQADSDYQEYRTRFEQSGTVDYMTEQLLRRYHNLNMRMATISVGADTTWKRELLYAQYQDAVQAAESAYYSGYNSGSGVAVMKALSNLTSDDTPSLLTDIIHILSDAYKHVYADILASANIPEYITYNDFLESYYSNIEDEDLMLTDYITPDGILLLHQFIIDYSIKTNTVFDITSNAFSNTIINSTNTDIEIIKAVIELISLMMTGNQVVIQK